MHTEECHTPLLGILWRVCTNRFTELEKKPHYSTTVAKSTWQTCFHRYWSTSQISVIKWRLTLLHWYEVHNNLWVQNIITVQLSQGFYFNIFRNRYYNATVVVSDDSARNCDILLLVHSIQDMRSLHLHKLILLCSSHVLHKPMSIKHF